MTQSDSQKGKLEAALWESQRAFSTLLSNLPGAAYRCLNDRSWTMDFISDGCFELTGYRPEEIHSGRISFGGDIIHPDDRQAVWEHVQQALAKQERFRLQYRIIRADGEQRWVWEQGLGIFSPEGELIALEGLLLDITDRVQASEEAERQRFFLNQVIDIMPHFVFAKDRAGRFTLVNRAVAEAYGTSVADLIGKTDSDFNPNAEEVAHFRQDDLAVMDSGKEKLIPEEKITDAAGQLHYLQTIKRPLPDSSGRVEQILGVATDITQIKLAEQRLRESAERLELALRAGNLATWDWDIVNDQVAFSSGWMEMLGYKPGDFETTAAALAQLIHPDDQARIGEAVNAALAGNQEIWEGEFRLRAPDGTWHWILDRGRVVERDAEGHPLRALGVHFDVSAQKRTEDRLRQIVQHMPGAIVVANSAGEIVLINTVAEQIFGYGPGELNGALIDQLVPESLRSSHVAERRSFFAAPASRSMGARRDLHALRKDGTEFPVEIGLQPLAHDQGMLVLASIVDLTDRKRDEDRLRQIVEHMPNAIIAVNELGAISMVNTLAEELFGYTREELSDMLVEQLVPERFRSQHPGLRDGFFASPAARKMGAGRELFALRKDGREVPVEIGLRPIETEEGTLVLAAIVDITERCKSEQRFRQVVENAPNAIVLINDEGQMLLVNNVAEKMFGYSRAELEGQTVEILVPQRFRSTHPGLRRGFFDAPSTRMMGEGRDLYALRKDGQEIPVEIGLRPIETDEGLLVLAAIIDITERKQAELALRESEARYRSLMEHAPVGIMIAVGETIKFANPAMVQLLSVTQESDLLGHSIYEFVTEEFHDSMRERLRTVEQDGQAVPGIDKQMKRSDGSILDVTISAVPIDYQGTVAAQIAAWDVTELHHAEAARRQIERRILHSQKLESLGVLAGGIAHDFNNLLAGILGNAGLAILDLPLEHPAREPLENINKGAKSASELTRQMLAYSGKGRFVIQPLNLTRLVDEMVHLLHTVITKKAVLRLDFADNIPTIEADVAQVRQVVMNLITNASDALAERSGVIMVRTGAMHASHEYLRSTLIPDDLESGAYAYVEVSDTGVGMDEQTLTQIFEPFYTTKFTGRGLGLAAVLGIVRGHKGAIRVYSEPGRGTTFKVLFPASQQEEAVEPLQEGFDPNWRGSGTVLVVDDEDTVRAVAQTILQRFGFTVEAVPNGRAGLDKFSESPDLFKLVLMDLTMPEMSGEELFRELRLLRPQVKVILMSGYNEQEATNLFVGKGLAAFLQKPFTPAELISVVRLTLGE